MGKCELSLELDEPGPFRCGGVVRGHLKVVAHEALKVDGSKVKVFFETRGKGTRHRGDDLVAVGGAFELAAGETREVPFEVTLPANGPVSFDGALISVVWLVHAELDVPWAFDPKDDLSIVVEPAAAAATPEGSYREAPDDEAPPAPPAKPSEFSTKHLVILGVLGALALFIMWQNAELANQTTRSGRNAHWHVYWMGALALFFAWKLAGQKIRNAFAARDLGTPDVSVSPGTVTRGEAVEVSVVVAPRGVADISRVVAKLVSTEHARWGGNRNRKSEEHVLDADVATLAENVLVERGRSQTFSARLGVPDSMAPSFSVPSNTISWAVVVTIVPKRGVDHVSEIPLQVLA